MKKIKSKTNYFQNTLKILLATTFILCFAGCSSVNVVEKGGQFIDGSMFAERTLANYRVIIAGVESSAIEVRQVQNRKSNIETLLITMAAFPTLIFRATSPERSGAFQLESVRFLAGSLSGWNEFTLDIIGGGVFTAQNGRGNIQMDSPIEPVSISSGRIRHKSDRFSGEKALSSLRNRYERITILTSWMQSLSDIPLFDNQTAFEKYWKPILLPEVSPRESRPSEYKTFDAEWVRSEEIRWNKTYTENFFPEELWTLRNSGSLLRDWEEAISWIYVIYQWDYIVEILSDRYTLKQSR